MKLALETVQMYKTSDDKTFESKDEAIEHQIQLNKPKIYLVEVSCDVSRYIEKAFLTRERAENYREKIKKDYNNSFASFYVKEIELGE